MTEADRETAEIDRIREEYRSRLQRLPSDSYALWREENLYFHSRIARACVRLLRRNGVFPIFDTRIADIGCGEGRWLLEFLQWGAISNNVYGLDLVPERLRAAQKRLAGAHLLCGDARQLPWPNGSFDIVTQFVVFSSVLEDSMRRKMAAEMLRVLRPGGRILWFDTRRNNPRNRALRGVTERQIRTLFPDCGIQCSKAIPVPFLARAVARRSWLAALALEKVPFACTHLVALITPGK